MKRGLERAIVRCWLRPRRNSTPLHAVDDRLGSGSTKLTVSITSPVLHLIADMRADIDFRRSVPETDVAHLGGGLILTPASVMSKLIKSSPACSGPEYVLRVSATISSI